MTASITPLAGSPTAGDVPVGPSPAGATSPLKWFEFLGTTYFDEDRAEDDGAW